MINLSKGESINLTKDIRGLEKITMGLGWQGKNRKNLDLDSYVALQDENGNNLSFVYFGKLSTKGVNHKGDDRVGGGSVDDLNEEIIIQLNKLDEKCTKIICGLFIFSGASNLSKVDYAFVQLLDQYNNKLVYYKIDQKFGKNKSLVVGEFYKVENEWSFKAVGLGSNDTFQTIKDRYTGNGNSTRRRGNILSRLFR